ncbi:MAG: PspA/IM30 family protein [Armatimonadetes bacterium]|nr:PspA/IM30 family protein [Armatimonadota bacterium]
MAVWNRVQTIVSANIHAMLDEAEDPGVVLKQLVRDMEQAVRQAQQNRVRATAELKLLEKRREQVAAEAGKWGARALRTLKRGDEELARQALQRQVQVETSLAATDQQLQRQRETIEAMASSVEQLKVRLEEARARSRTAGAQAGVVTSAAKASFDITPFEEFDRIAERLDIEGQVLVTVAELEADQLEQRFAKAEADAQIEARLAQLKASMSTGKA